MSTLAKCLLASTSLMFVISEVAAQRPDCTRCELSLRKLWHLDTGSANLTFWPRTVVGSKSHFYMVSVRKELPFRVDRNGQHEQLLGRSGAGPGEFLFPTAIAVDGAQNVHVFDPALGRRQVFDSGLKLVSATTIGGSQVIAAIVLSNRSTVVNMGAGSGTVLRPLHLLDPSGRVTKSFGDEIREAQPEGRRQNYAVIRRFARSSRGGFWAAHAYEPIIEEYDASGGRMRRITIASRLFVKRPQASIGKSTIVRGERAAGSSVVGLWETADGLVVIVFLVPTDAKYDGANRWGMFRTAIELVEPVRGGVVLAGKVFDGETIATPEAGLIAMYSETDGHPRLEAFQVEIRHK